MLILVIMMLGVVIGMKLNLKKTLKVNGVLQIVLTGILEAEKTFLMNWQNLAGRVCSICCLRWQDLF